MTSASSRESIERNARIVRELGRLGSGRGGRILGTVTLLVSGSMLWIDWEARGVTPLWLLALWPVWGLSAILHAYVWWREGWPRLRPGWLVGR